MHTRTLCGVSVRGAAGAQSPPCRGAVSYRNVWRLTRLSVSCRAQATDSCTLQARKQTELAASVLSRTERKEITAAVAPDNARATEPWLRNGCHGGTSVGWHHAGPLAARILWIYSRWEGEQALGDPPVVCSGVQAWTEGNVFPVIVTDGTLQLFTSWRLTLLCAYKLSSVVVSL